MQKRGMQKKAFVEVQFNWIFVLIVGAIIIIFFMNLSSRQQDISTKKLSADLLTSIDVIVTGQSVSVGRTSTLDMPPVAIDFTCDTYTIFTQSKPVGDVVVFAPSTIKGPKIITWTLDWGLRAAAYSSFKAANFVYLTSSNAKYYFVRDSPDMEGIIEVMKEEMPKDMDISVITPAELAALPYENNYHVTFVFFDLAPSFPDRFRNADTALTALKIDFGAATPMIESFNGNIGLSFYHAKQGAWVKEADAIPFGKEAVYGSIFSDTAEQFTCNMGKALEKLTFVSDVYQRRAAALEPSLFEICKADFTDGKADLQAIHDIARKGTGMSTADINSLYTTTEDLKRLMGNLKLNSCPLLY